jgi:hypothetical protein
VVTSTRELLRFARMHMDDGAIDGVRRLPDKAARAMREPIVEAGDFHRQYGIGWCIHDYPEFRTISHGGATRGFRANLTAIPEKGFAIAILTNGDPGSRAIQEIEAWALASYLGFERPVPVRIPLANKQLKAFAGEYRRHDGRFTVSVVDDRLDLRVESLDEESGEVEDDKTSPLLPVGERRFRVPDGPNKGAIVDVIAYAGNGREQEFLRTGGRLAERETGTPEAGPKAGTAKKGKVKGTKT